MSLPSEANLQTAIGKAIKVFDQTRAFGNANSPNFVAMAEDYLDEVPPDSTAAAQDAMLQLRGALAGMLAPAAAQGSLNPLWTTYGRVKLYANTDSAAVLVRLFKDFAEAGTPTTVESRGYTYGSLSSITGTGNGSISRLTVDGYNYTIESPLIAEAKSFICTQDVNAGARLNQEVWEYRGSSFGKDFVNITGTGGLRTFQCLSAEASPFPNCSFEGVNGISGSTFTSMTGWSVGSAWTNFETVTGSAGGNIYKVVNNAATSRSLRFKTNDYIYQSFREQGVSWNPTVPLFAQVAFKRESSCDGTLTLTIGGKSVSVALSAQSGWTILRFTVGQDAWFRRWDANSALVKLELSGNTTGDLLVDDLVIGAYTPLETAWGSWVAIVGGSTPFLRDDLFTVTDTCSEGGIIQRWMARTYGMYFPHSGSPTWADPS